MAGQYTHHIKNGNSKKQIAMKYIFIFLISLFFSLNLQAKEYKYIERIKDCYTDIFWKIKTEKYWTVLEARRAQETYTTTNDSHLNSLEWHLVNTAEKTDILAKRQKNLITISGVFKSKPIERKIKIDKDPWYQPMSFSLSKLIKSRKKAITFWTLNPTNLKPYKMKALNYGKETIDINGKETQAYKIKVILTGFRSMFWHAFYWYRADDNTLIQYKGVDGPPTSPTTSINLVEESF
jgi:hypothetical protein